MSDMTLVRRWLSRAQDDLLVARRLFEDFHPKQLEISCYQCQQAAEKALKAYLISKEYEFPFTHDLVRLCQICLEFHEGFDDLLEDCADLSPYATQARYPNEIPIDEVKTLAALQKAERVMALCVSLIEVD